MTDLGWPELLIVAVIAMMLFGTKKMPEIARSLGRSMRIVKAELGGLKDDDTAATPAPAVQPVGVEPVAAPEPVAAAEPVVAQPVVAQPVVAQPVVAQPVVAQPVAPPAGEAPIR